MKNLKIFVLINLIIAAISTVLTLSFSFDLSLLAFPISLVFSFFLFYFSKKVFIDEKLNFIGTLRRFFQYEPFVFISAFVLQRAGKKSFPFVYDLIFVLLWIAILIISSIILYYISEKRMTSLSKKWKDYRENNPIVKAKGLKKVLIEKK